MEFLYWLEGIRTPVLDTFFSLFTHFGSETLFIVLAIVIFWCVNKQTGYYLMTVGFIGTMLNQFLKLVCRIPRPWVRDPAFTIVEAARADATGYSFPSGHTQSAATVFGCPARAAKSKLLRAVLIIAILLVGLSRMYLGVHTPADVGVSLVIGAVLVLGLYPLFEKGEENPGRMFAVMAALVGAAMAYVLFVELYPWPADMDAHNLEHGIENGYTLLGCSTAMLLSCYLERKYIRFEVKAPLWAQLIKTILGLVLVLAIKEGMRPVLNALCGGHPIARTLRYFLMVMFAACVWPLTFRWFQKMGEGKP